MSDFIRFIVDINRKIGISLPSQWTELTEIQVAQRFLEKLNEYFFQTHEEIGTTTFNGEELQYFSEFHKFWEANYEAILNPRIDDEQARIAAQSLVSAIGRYGSEILGLTLETCDLAPEAIAQVRYLTANQDFREPPENQFEKYYEDPTQFDARTIADGPANFLRFLGMTRLSQTDKRLDYARNAAQFLIDRRISASEIARCFNNDATQIRKALVETSNNGYGFKKANMFIRDMAELHVWPELGNFEMIDVASDINTMKVALRTRILKTDIPLLSSFLDIFCYQYSCVDEMSAQAWRRVWENCQNIEVADVLRSPCQLDYLLYRIGREYCKEIVVQYNCDEGHLFYHFGARLRNCMVCRNTGVRSPAHPQQRFLPCQLESTQLPRENGVLLLRDDKLLKTFDGVCIFETVCEPNSDEFRTLNAPQSISIKGQTGWTKSYAYRGRGGGGMMG